MILYISLPLVSGIFTEWKTMQLLRRQSLLPALVGGFQQWPADASLLILLHLQSYSPAVPHKYFSYKTVGISEEKKMLKMEIKENTSTYSIDNSAIPESVKFLTLCGIKMVRIFMCMYVFFLLL